MAGVRDESILRRMAGSLSVHGEAESNVFLSADVGLGFGYTGGAVCPTCTQPAFNEDGTVCVVCEGELLNSSVIRKNLIDAGHVLRHDGTADIIAHAYEQHGIGCVELFHGEIAFAVWDETEYRLMIFSDRIGKKPIFYKLTQDHLYFSSSVFSLRAGDTGKCEADLRAVDDYLSYGFVPGDRTLYNDIRRLPPAHIMIYRRGAVRLSRYWQLPHRNRLHPKAVAGSLEDLVGAMSNSIALRQSEPVSFGLAFDGSRSSRALLHLSRLSSKGRDKALFAYYSGGGRSGFREKLGCRVTDVVPVEVTPDRFKRLRIIYRSMDAPVADLGVILFDSLCESASGAVDRIMTGSGLEEIMGISAQQKMLMNIHKCTETKSMAKKWLSACKAFLSPRLVAGDVVKDWDVLRLEAGLCIAGMIVSTRTPVDRYEPVSALFTSDLKRSLYTDWLLDCMNDYSPGRWDYFSRSRYDGAEQIDRMIMHGLNGILPCKLLPVLNSIATVHDFTVDTPFLDHGLLESAAALSRVYIPNSVNDDILMKILDNLEIASTGETRKSVLSLTSRDYLNVLSKVFRKYLNEERIRSRGWFHTESVGRIMEMSLKGNLCAIKRAFSLTVLEIWCNFHID